MRRYLILILFVEVICRGAVISAKWIGEKPPRRNINLIWAGCSDAVKEIGKRPRANVQIITGAYDYLVEQHPALVPDPEDQPNENFNVVRLNERPTRIVRFLAPDELALFRSGERSKGFLRFIFSDDTYVTTEAYLELGSAIFKPTSLWKANAHIAAVLKRGVSIISIEIVLPHFIEPVLFTTETKKEAFIPTVTESERAVGTQIRGWLRGQVVDPRTYQFLAPEDAQPKLSAPNGMAILNIAKTWKAADANVWITVLAGGTESQLFKLSEEVTIPGEFDEPTAPIPTNEAPGGNSDLDPPTVPL